MKNSSTTIGCRRPFRARGMARTNAGSAFVEMIVIAPFLLFVLIGLITAGQVGNYAILVANAARAGVQFGAQNLATAGDTQGMQNAAMTDAQVGGITAVAAPTYCSCSDGTASTCAQGDCAASHRIEWVKVTASGTVTSPLNSNFVPPLLRTVTISQTAIMRVAQ